MNNGYSPTVKPNGSRSDFGVPRQNEEEEVRRLRAVLRRPPSQRSRFPQPRKPVRRPTPRRPRYPRTINYGNAVFSEPQPGTEGSEYIRWVQTTLNQALNLQLPVDGISNVQTRSAIRSFQEKNGLPVTGMVGPDTERALMAAGSGQSQGVGTAPPATEFEFERESQINRKSREYINWVQQSLNQILGLRLAVDGKLGPQTRSAIRSFQQQRGLKADGVVGEKTEAAIKAALNGHPRATNTRMVNPAKVSCANYNRNSPIFKAIGTTDPVGVLEALSQRAVQMLDNTIAEMSTIQKRVGAGEPPAWPVLNDIMAWSLKTRMLMPVNDPKAWTGSGTPDNRRTAGLIIRWLSNIRKIIAGGQLWYTCLASSGCAPTTWAWVFCDKYRINLCRRFWHPKAGVDLKTHFEFQAQTIIHEASHIYYCTEDKGLGPGAAECISQFVADANGSPIDADFVGRCGPKEPALR